MRTIKIGRSAGNDLTLSNLKVSGYHATLVVQDNEMSATLKDLNSTNGTYVNGRRITGETVVRPTDVIRFGTEETSLQRILAQIAAQAPAGGDKTRISPASGGGQRYTIGRSPGNQIVMPQSDVSGNHAVLSRDGQGNVILQDLGSTNGTFVNGQRITGQRMLNAGDRVTLTGNGYPLDWQSYVGSPAGPATPNPMEPTPPISPTPTVYGPPTPQTPPVTPAATPPKKNNTALWIILGVLALAAIGAGLFFGLKGCDGTTGSGSDSTSVATDTTTPPPAGPTVMTGAEINEKYKDAVCMIIGQWGVNVYAMTEQGKVQLTSLEGGQYTGTAFCISEDGTKYATNLHCVQAWVFAGEAMNALKVQANSYVRSVDPGYEAILEGVAKLYILPNGKPLSLANATEVTVYKVPNLDGVEQPVLNKDVAIVQTITRERPSGINGWIDPNAVGDPTPFYQPGKEIHSIGYPAGMTLAQNSNEEMVNQLHSGRTSQDKGDFQFGVDFTSTGGASGSPVLNEYGQLIGVFNSGYGNGGPGALNYAVKLKHLQDLLNQ